MRVTAFMISLFVCAWFSMQQASLYFFELTTLLPVSPPEGILEQMLNFVVILVSVAGVIIAGISKSKPKKPKDKVEQKSKSNVKHKKTAPKRSRKVKPNSSGSPFKQFFKDAKEKTK